MQNQNELKLQPTTSCDLTQNQKIKDNENDWFKVKLKDLDCSLKGVKINRVAPLNSDNKSEYAKHVQSLAHFFSDRYSNELNKKDEKEYFYHLFCERARLLNQPNQNNINLILEAVQSSNNKILGVVQFKKMGNNEVLLSSLSTDSYNSARGIGTQLMIAFLETWPDTQVIHGLVRRENKRAIEIYKHFAHSNCLWSCVML